MQGESGVTEVGMEGEGNIKGFVDEIRGGGRRGGKA